MKLYVIKVENVYGVEFEEFEFPDDGVPGIITLTRCRRPGVYWLALKSPALRLAFPSPRSRALVFDEDGKRERERKNAQKYAKVKAEREKKRAQIDEWFARFRARREDSKAVALSPLGLRPDATEQEVRQAYRKLASELHPDKGGSEAAFRLLRANYEQALEAVARGAA